jgi:tRNA (guanine37-N1)-methyltransferase
VIRFDILSVFPEMLHSPLQFSLLKKAQEKGLIEIGLHDIRDWAEVEPVERALAAVKRTDVQSLVILMTPQGEKFSQKIASELSEKKHLILICGRYEGFDERIRQHLADREISIGDYILTGGELSSLVVVDAVSRLIPGVLGNDESATTESFSGGLLEYPQYTRPAEYKGWCVPDVLVSGNHAQIEQWRRIEALKRTWRRRPDLLEKIELSGEDEKKLEKIKLDQI